MAGKKAIKEKEARFDTKPDIAFGMAVREIRKKEKITLEVLAWNIKMDLSFLHQIETGKRGATIKSLIRIANGLEVSPESIIKQMQKFLETIKDIADTP